MEPTLSIIIPIYNVQAYLPACLESAIAQKIPGIEFICVNDGSTDSSPDILRQFAARDERIVVIDKPNAGYGAAMNDGLKAARGEYVGILESDDRVCDGAWQSLLDLATSNDLDLVRGSYLTCAKGAESPFDPHANVATRAPGTHPPLPFDEVFKPADFPLCFWVNPSLWAGLYRRSFLEDNDIRFLETPGAAYQDTSFGFKAWALAERAMLTRDPVVYYNVENEASSSNSKGKVFAICEELHEAERFLEERSLADALGPALVALRYRTYTWNAGRVADEFKEDFCKVMREELSRDRENGWCDPALLGHGACEHIDRIIEQTPSATVVLAAGKAGAELDGTLKHLKNLTGSDVEIICAPYGDGASKAAQALEAYARTDDRAAVLGSQEDLAAAFSAGMAAAQGAYLLFMEETDWLEKRAVERMVALGDRYSLDAAVSRWKRTMGGKACSSESPLLDWPHAGQTCATDDALGCALRFDTSLLANKLFRRSFLKEHGIRFDAKDSVASFVRSALTESGRALVVGSRLATKRLPGDAPDTDFDALLQAADEVRRKLPSNASATSELDYARWVSSLYAFGMKERASELERCRARLADANRKLTAVRNSRAYKAGRAITAPARAIKKALGHSKKS